MNNYKCDSCGHTFMTQNEKDIQCPRCRSEETTKTGETDPYLQTR